MKTIIYNTYALGLLIFLLLVNTSKVAATDSIIFTAMRDEMARSMNYLQYEDYEKPFYIGYALTMNKSLTVKASLGTLITSRSRSNNSSSVRLIVGDHQLTNEKFNDKVNKIRNNDGYSPMPKDINYWGIRRSLWLATNNVYKNAAEKYKNKVGLMAQNNITREVMTSPDFSKEIPIVKIYDELPEEISHKQLEKIGRDISEVFLNTPEIIESSVVVEYQNNVRFFLNSEGSKTKMPFRFYSIIVKAAIVANDNKTINQQLGYNVKSISDLPSLEDMKADAVRLVDNLKETANAADLNSNYNGPVLFLDKAISQMILKEAMQKNNSLIARPNNLIYDKEKGLFYGNDSWDAMISKKAIDRKISLISVPCKAKYNEKTLLGHSFQIDLEAVKAPDTLVLVENGILLNQLNSRRPTTSQYNSNGHKQFYVNKTNVFQKIGGGVIVLKSSETQTIDELSKRQKELALEEDIEQVILVRTLKSNADNNPINYYKLDIATGKEELIRKLDYKPTLKEFRAIEGVSGNLIMHNTLVPDKVAIENRMKKYSRYPPEIRARMRLETGTQGIPTTFIFPDAVLMESLELKSSSEALHTKKRAVPNPLTNN